MSNIRAALLSKGFFPRELPQVFTTEMFGQHSTDIISDWERDGVFKITSKPLGKTPCKKKRKNAYTYELMSAEAETISKPKRGYERRNIHITHPIPQALLASELADNWPKVQKWLSRQEFSEDEIRVSAEHERSIKGINFTLHRAKKAYLESTSDWLVKTDITRFYPSIYTHSIPWAAYGKENVKRRMGYYKGSLADRLDVLVRACNRNQTIGIPIGPETSRIISEIISSRIDMEFDSGNRYLPKASVDRLQDDWAVGVETLEKAEGILSSISSIYRSYGLDINGSKTSIEHIVAAKQSTWVSEIGAFLSHRPGALRGARLREFLIMCLRLQADHSSEPVVNYALTVIENTSVVRADVEAMESFLLKAAVVAPNSMDRICRIILNLQYHTKSISAKRIGARFVRLAERSLEKGHHFEVIWLLYALRGLKRPFESKFICEASEFCQSSSLPLLLLEMKHKGLGIGNLPRAQWEAQISEDRVLSDWSWLLAYEGFRHGWLTDVKGLMKQPFFKPMADRNVAFYDPRKNVETSKSFVAKRKRLRRSQNIEVKLMFEDLRGFDTGEY